MKTILASFYTKYKKWIGPAAMLCAAVWVLHGCFSKPPKPKMSARPVKTAVAFEKDVPVTIEAFGNLNAPNNVDIKSQVIGQIIGVQFVEGQEVKKGDLLFTIDPSPFKAELQKARAAMIQDEADYKMKKDTLERNREIGRAHV
jgi:membrane fusion protein, multidrug efflux system